MILRHALPRTVERGVTTALTADVYSGAGAQQTATVATVAISDGNTEILAATAATSLGPPASYTLTGATTTGLGLSSTWLEVWEMTIGGQVYHFRRPAMLVRHAFVPTITDTDLVARHVDLLNSQVLPSSITSYETYRQAAEEMIQRALLRRGRRPWLIFDAWELTDAHIECTLHLIMLDFASSLGDGRYKELADYYGKKWIASFDAMQFRYDETEDGDILTENTVASVPFLNITAGAPNVYEYSGPGIPYGRCR